MLLYSSTIFLSAFLLFLVQPVIAKMILPWFGGSPAVWTTCMVFFQLLLLFGYLYAHATTRRLSPRMQILLHVTLLGVSLFFLPLAPDPGWKPRGNEDPSFRILVLLTASIGLPYFLLSTTSPLIQVWYTRTFEAALPYRLFALSNLASLIALFSFPVLIEPWISGRSQALVWSALYTAFAGLCIAAALRTRKVARVAPAAKIGDPPGVLARVRWILFAGCASLLLVAVTNHLTQNVAAIPFLWILPLGLYLLTFILCFDREGLYRRDVFIWLLAAALGGMSYALLVFDPDSTLEITIPVFSAGLFICCMFCHGELALQKPAAAHLSSFYLMISIGGAAGSLFVGFIAPRLFSTYLEMPLGLVLCSSMALFLFYKRSIVTGFVLAAVAIGTVVSAVTYKRTQSDDVRIAVRSFFGGLRVMDHDGTRMLIHGAVNHGTQFLDRDRRNEPTMYYGRGSGVGHALAGLGDAARRVGVIGLGAGTLAAYGRKGDVFRFYEINPQVVEIAQKEFAFLHDSPAHVEVVVGDGRLSLEREEPQAYDLLVVDAFSGDSIPAHLLSHEAMELYFRHLKPDGIVAMHISNATLDLWPVVNASARATNKECAVVTNPSDKRLEVSQAMWAIVANSRIPLDRPALARVALRPDTRRLRVWTDDYSNLFQILK